MIKIDNGNMFRLKLADCYYANHKYGLAEQSYLKAICIVPNRFTTRFKLLNYYINTKQVKKAKDVGLKLLALPVKIPSSAIDEIRRKTKVELSSL